MFRLLFIFTLCIAFFFSTAIAQDEPSQFDPGRNVSSTISGIRYSVPKGYKLEKSGAPNSAFLRGKNATAIFLKVSEAQPNSNELTEIASAAATQFLPSERSFKWKPTGVDSDAASKFEVAGGGAKGQSQAKKTVQVFYKVVKTQAKFITVGYIMEFGDETPAQSDFDFNADGSLGASMPAWYALAHVMVSLTHEKYDEVLEKLPVELTSPIN
jgi:hypothetical protein